MTLIYSGIPPLRLVHLLAAAVAVIDPWVRPTRRKATKGRANVIAGRRAQKGMTDYLRFIINAGRRIDHCQRETGRRADRAADQQL